MAELAQTAENPATDNEIESVYRGPSRNMALGVAFTAAGASAFMMGMTDVFFAEAIAWTFVIWGILFVLVDLADMAQTYVVTEDGLEIKNALRFWDQGKFWKWEDINRMDVLVKRPEAKLKDAEIQIHCQTPDNPALQREDRDYDPVLARQIIDHAGLTPQEGNNLSDLLSLPKVEEVYTWKK
ncbi:MAG: US12 family protein [Caldilineaceae bacterium]|nr:US12 family protein [Caldilineaceae bacterium]